MGNILLRTSVPLILIAILAGCQTPPVRTGPLNDGFAKVNSAHSTSTAKGGTSDQHSPDSLAGLNYDQKFSYLIQSKWFQAIEKSHPLPRGLVEIEFRLHEDGRVTRINTRSSNVGEAFESACRSAVDVSVLKLVWPQELKDQYEDGYRDIIMSFTY
jgi:hypothetical protein